MKKLVGITLGVILLGLTGCTHYGYGGEYYVDTMSVGVAEGSGSYYDYHPYYYYHYRYRPYYHYYRAPYYHHYGW